MRSPPATSCGPSSSTCARASASPAPAVVAVGGTSKGRPVVVVATNAAARERGVRAGALVRTASGILGGGGGGKDDLAQGGGTDADKLVEALARACAGAANG